MPYDPDGRRGREGYRLVTLLASMPPTPIFDDEEPPIAESMAPGSEDAERARRAPPRVTLVTLPTEAELEEGYVYGRDVRWSVSITQVRWLVGRLTNQRILNVQNAQDVYRFLSLAAHEDVSCLTLHPIEYRSPGRSLRVTFGGGLVADKPSFRR